jgi:hypothetical protein
MDKQDPLPYGGGDELVVLGWDPVRMHIVTQNTICFVVSHQWMVFSRSKQAMIIDYA